MSPITREFTFLTAAFPHGAYQSLGANQPDLRAPSIKGQLRWWYDALFNDKTSEDILFGGLHNPIQGGGSGPESSRVIVRIQEVRQTAFAKTQFIPHKGQRGGEKKSILPGTGYRVSLMPRRNGINSEERSKLERVLDTWLLLGAVGQRANRGAGSIASADAPGTVADYEARANQFLSNTELRAAILSKTYDNEKALRYEAGDFLDSQAFGHPTPFGSAKPRMPSLLKLRAARIDCSLRLVALWDGRYQDGSTLRQGIQILKDHPKEIGRLLSEVSRNLCPS